MAPTTVKGHRSRYRRANSVKRAWDVDSDHRRASPQLVVAGSVTMGYRGRRVDARPDYPPSSAPLIARTRALGHLTADPKLQQPSHSQPRAHFPPAAPPAPDDTQNAYPAPTTPSTNEKGSATTYSIPSCWASYSLSHPDASARRPDAPSGSPQGPFRRSHRRSQRGRWWVGGHGWSWLWLLSSMLMTGRCCWWWVGRRVCVFGLGGLGLCGRPVLSQQSNVERSECDTRERLRTIQSNPFC